MSSSPTKRRASAPGVSANSRLDKWTKTRQNALVVPLLAQGVRRTKHKVGIRVHFDRIDGFRLPPAFAKELKGASKSKLEFCIHLSLFHTSSQSFFGNTWVSPLQKASMSGKKSSRLDLSSIQVALCTRIADPGCLAVAEIVVVEKDASGNQILGQYGVGWTSMPLFAAVSSLASATNKSQKQKVKVYSGSPRALLFMDADGPNSKEDALQPLQDCTMVYVCSNDTQMTKISHLVRLNEFVGPGQSLGGLREGTFPTKSSSNAKLSSSMDLFINLISILLPAQWEEQAQSYLQLRKGLDKHEAGNKFVLKVAPHNGRTAIDKNGWTQIPLKASEFSDHPDYDQCLRYEKSVRLRQFPKDNQVAIAFQLEYHTASIQTSGPVVVGCGIWLPFSSDSSGPKLTMTNIKAKDASTKAPLQISLRSDAQCPFTDDGIFLPSRRGETVLPILGVHLGRKAEVVRRQRSPSKSSRRNRKSRHGWGSESGSDVESRGSGSSDSNESDTESNSGSDSDSSPVRKRKDRDESSGSEASHASRTPLNSDDDSDDSVDGYSQVSESRHNSRSRSRVRQSKNKRSSPHGRAHVAHQRSLSRGRVATKLGQLASASQLPYGANVDDNLLSRMLSLRMHDENMPAATANATQSYTTNYVNSMQNKGSSDPIELSRASRTILNRMGVLDNMRTVVPPLRHDPDIETELKDRFLANEITFQFAAYRHIVGDLQLTARPQSVFFTFQFYDSLPTRTERMSLRASGVTDTQSNMEAGLSKPYILMRGNDSDGKHRNSPSQALRFLVDTSTTDESEPKRFAQYLKDNMLYIQVWDAESLLSLGLVAIRLAEIMRQGERSTKLAREFDVIAPTSIFGSSGIQEIDLFDNGNARGCLNGKVQLIITNYGIKGQGKRNLLQKEANNCPLVDKHWHMDRTFGTSSMNVAEESGKGGPRHRVIARPLAQANSQLEGLLRAANSSSRREMRRAESQMKIADGAVLEADWALSEADLQRIARTLDRANAGLVPITTVLTYLQVDESSTKEASRAWSKLRSCEPLCALDTYHVFNNLDSENTGCVSESTFQEILRTYVPCTDVSENEVGILAKRFQEGASQVNYERFLKQLIGSHVGDLESKLRRVLRKARSSSGVTYKEAFQHHFDANGDGRIQARELKRGLLSLNFQATSADIDLLLKRYGDGKCLLLTDFVALAEAKVPSSSNKTTAKQSFTDMVREIVLEAEARGINLRDTFAHFDKDGNGKISVAECKKGLVDIGIKSTDKNISELMGQLDVDGSGEVELDEFLSFIRSKATSQSSCKESSDELGFTNKVRAIVLKAQDNGVNVRDTFAHLDKDGNGFITQEECGEGLASIGCTFTPEELSSLFQTIDQNSSGQVDMMEFLSFLTKPSDEVDVSGNDSKTDHSEASIIQRFRELLKQNNNGGNSESFFPFLKKKGRSSIERTEFIDCLKRFGLDTFRPEQLDTLVAHFEKDKSGEVSVSAFQKFFEEATFDPENTPAGFLEAHADRIKRRCRKHDRKDRGTISLSHFNRIVEDLGWDDEYTAEELGDIVLEDERVDYERLGKDLVREKLVKAVRKAFEKGINVPDMVQSLDRQNVGKVNLSQIRRLIVDLGFSILERSQASSALSSGVYGSSIGDNSSRQLNKIERLRQARMIRSSKNGMYEDLGLDRDFGDAFARQASDLQLVQRFREGHKRDVVGSFLRTSMTREVTLYPKFASASYFEIELSNPFPQEERFHIKIDDPELRCITDGEEWRYYRERITPISKPENFYPVESEMITPDNLEVTLNSNESVAVPFSFLSFASGQPGQEALGQERKSIRERTIIVRFISARHAHAVLEVHVRINPKPFVVHRALELHSGVGEFAKAQVKLHGQHTGSEKFLYCNDPDAAVQWKDDTVTIRYRGRTDKSIGGEFFVVLYKDSFHAEMEAIWLVSVQPMQRVNFHGVVGQSASSELIIKGDNFSRRVQCFTSNPGETQLHPVEPFQLVAGAFNRIELIHRPLVETSPGCTSQIRVHLVDLDSHELISAWLVKATAALPEVSKTFDVDLSCGHAAHKKIAYVNPWNEPRKFTIRTSDPVHVRAKDPELEIPPKTKAYIRLWFAAAHKSIVRQVLIFVNDEDGQNEECLLLKATYKP